MASPFAQFTKSLQWLGKPHIIYNSLLLFACLTSPTVPSIPTSCSANTGLCCSLNITKNVSTSGNRDGNSLLPLPDTLFIQVTPWTSLNLCSNVIYSREHTLITLQKKKKKLCSLFSSKLCDSQPCMALSMFYTVYLLCLLFIFCLTLPECKPYKRAIFVLYLGVFQTHNHFWQIVHVY